MGLTTLVMDAPDLPDLEPSVGSPVHVRTLVANGGAERVVVLMDVDGVLAPTGHPDDESDALWCDLPPGVTWFYRSVLERLKALAGTDLVDFRWLTTWHDQATLDLAPAVGLPDWPYYDNRDAPPIEQYPYAEWWKERVVRTILATGARVVWVDDEVPWRVEADLLARRFADQLLLVVPDPHEGLTVPDIDRIETWARTGEGRG